MGSFYASVVVRGPTEEQVVEILHGLGRVGYVASKDDFVFVYDREADKQREGVVESLALTLATRLGCPALASLNHDDSALLLWLYDETGGELRFAYGATLDPGDRSADIAEFTDQLSHVFGTSDRPPEPSELPLRLRLLFKLLPLSFAVLRHERILRAARIPPRPAMMGYDDVLRGEFAVALPGLPVRPL